MIEFMILDDEVIAHEIILDYAQHFPQLDFKVSCYDAFEAINFLTKQSVDLIFLDINMPKISGFDFVKTLANAPTIIVTSAHQEFALEGYELNISDYLLKPFSLQRFSKAVLKVQSKEKVVDSRQTDSLQKEAVFIKEGKKQVQLKLNDIKYIESYGNYNKIYTSSRMVTVFGKMSEVLDLLDHPNFIQVHKSFIVSKNHIESILDNQIFIGEKSIPIGQTYKHQVKSIIGSS